MHSLSPKFFQVSISPISVDFYLPAQSLALVHKHTFKFFSFSQNHEDFELKKLLFDMILSLSKDPAFIAVRFLNNVNFLLKTRLLYQLDPTS